MEIAAEEGHEPVVIDLASGSGCSSDADTASETEGFCLFDLILYVPNSLSVIEGRVFLG